LPVLGLDRRQKHRLARGSEAIDSCIDLHGKTQSEAHAALLGFLRHAQAQGARYVLVITGKGRPASALRLSNQLELRDNFPTLTLLDSRGGVVATLGGPVVKHLVQ